MKITISSSIKNLDIFEPIAEELRNRGHVVFAPIKFNWSEIDSLSDPTKRYSVIGTAREFFDNIAKSDLMIVCNPNGYAGYSVSMEIGCAIAKNKLLFALFKDSEIARDVLYDEILGTIDPKKIADKIEKLKI